MMELNELTVAFLFGWRDPQVSVRVRDGKKLVHEGIKIEFVGSIGRCFPAENPFR